MDELNVIDIPYIKRRIELREKFPATVTKSKYFGFVITLEISVLSLVFLFFSLWFCHYCLQFFYSRFCQYCLNFLYSCFVSIVRLEVFSLNFTSNSNYPQITSLYKG